MPSKPHSPNALSRIKPPKPTSPAINRRIVGVLELSLFIQLLLIGDRKVAVGGDHLFLVDEMRGYVSDGYDKLRP